MCLLAHRKIYQVNRFFYEQVKRLFLKRRSDISNGLEYVKIPCVNEVDNELFPNITVRIESCASIYSEFYQSTYQIV